MKPIILALFLSGCSVASYTRTDGEVKVTAYFGEVGTDRGVDGLKLKTDNVEFSFDSSNTLQSKSFSESVRAFVEALKLSVGLP